MSTDTAVRARKVSLAREQPRMTLRYLGPNWYSAVMGTGIVANAAAMLPHQFKGLLPLAAAAWIFATLLLIAITAGFVTHWIRHPLDAAMHHTNPIMAQFTAHHPWHS